MSDKTTRLIMIHLLKNKRRRISPAHRRRRSRPVKWLYPWAIEKQYAAQIKAWMKPLRFAVIEYLKAHGEGILRGDQGEWTIHDEDTSPGVQRIEHNTKTLVWHTDNIPGSGFRIFVRTLRAWVERYFPEGESEKKLAVVTAGIIRLSDLAHIFAGKEWNKQMKAILGQPFPASQSWWPEMRDAWAEDNYRLIKTVATRYIEDVNRNVEQAILSGLSYKDLVDNIEGLNTGITGWQAERLARDQIGKLNSNISQQQLEEAGIDMYIWSTANDERVRDSHEPLDGMICRWDDSTVYSEDGGKTWIPRPADWCDLHPGQDIQCRCTSIPYVENLLREVDNSLEEEAA